MNQMPIRFEVSSNRKALAARLPMRFRVYIPWGAFDPLMALREVKCEDP